MLLIVVGVLFAGLALLYFYATRHFSYWKKNGVTSVTAPTIVGAAVGSFLGYSEKLYKYAPKEPYVGVVQLTSLAIAVRDPELLRLIMSKDFSHFHDRGNVFSEKRDPLSAHLFNMEGRRWKILRAKLTPTFTSGKLRGMYPHMAACAKDLEDVVGSQYLNKFIDVREILYRYSTDVILNCAFGLKGNSLRNSDDLYYRMIKLNFKGSLFKRIEATFFEIFPGLQEYFPLSSDRSSIVKFFKSTFSSSVKQRESGGVKRNDFLDLLLEIKKHGSIVDSKEDADSQDPSFEFTAALMAAQAFVFYVAGGETSSATSSFAMLELAHNIDIQNRLRAEVDAALQKHGSLSYEAIQDMPYLDQVISETLRLYSPLKRLIRIVTRPYTMPDGVVLPKGTRVYIPVFQLHRDERLYPDPLRFDPERFSPENKPNIHKFAYLPFGEGPRICIGARFGLVQTKLSVATLLSKFEVRPKPDVPYPPEMNELSDMSSAVHGTPVIITKRRDR